MSRNNLNLFCLGILVFLSEPAINSYVKIGKTNKPKFKEKNLG